MTERTQFRVVVWIWALAIIAFALVIAQVRGQLMSSSLPFLAGGGASVIGPDIPDQIGTNGYRWVYTNANLDSLAFDYPATNWVDIRNNREMTNIVSYPIATSNGVYFNRSGWLHMTNTLPFGVNADTGFSNSYMMVLLLDRTVQLQATWGHATEFYANYISNNVWIWQNGTNSMVGTLPAGVISNSVFDLIVSAGAGGSNYSKSYINGVEVTNTFGGMDFLSFGNDNSSEINPSDTFSGSALELIYWTNTVLSSANVSNLHYYATNRYASIPTDFCACSNTMVASATLKCWYKSDYCWPYTLTAKTCDTIVGAGAECPHPVPGGPIGRWFNNVAGPASTLNNGGGSTRVIWNAAGGANNQPYLYKSGTADFLAGASLSLAQPFTYFVVLQITSTNATTEEVFVSNDFSGQNFGFVSFMADGLSYSNHMYAGSNAYLPRTPTVTNWTVVTWCFNGANSFMRTNGVQVGVCNPGTGALGNIEVGALWTGASPFIGNYSELLIYQGSINTNDIQLVENYLGGKYAITIGP